MESIISSRSRSEISLVEFNFRNWSQITLARHNFWNLYLNSTSCRCLNCPNTFCRPTMVLWWKIWQYQIFRFIWRCLTTIWEPDDDIENLKSGRDKVKIGSWSAPRSHETVFIGSVAFARARKNGRIFIIFIITLFLYLWIFLHWYALSSCVETDF